VSTTILRRAAGPDGTGSGRPPSSADDERAAEVLLSFARMARSPRDASGLPNRVEELMKSGVLAPRHVSLFAVISLLGPLSVSELAARGGLALSTTSLLVTQLAEAGLVERSESEVDRRRTLVATAPDYLDDGEAVVEVKLAPLRRALSRMGPERATALLEALDIMVEEVAQEGHTVEANGARITKAAPVSRSPGSRRGDQTARTGGGPA
jgi:DNA-binding MarR family transcriptional regulator